MSSSNGAYGRRLSRLWMTGFTLLAYVQENNLDGVNIDDEQMGATNMVARAPNRELVTRFFQVLAQTFKATNPQYHLSFAAPPVIASNDRFATTWLDLKAIAEVVDAIIPMGWYCYRDGDAFVQGWFNDAKTWTAKLMWVREQGLGALDSGMGFSFGYDGKRVGPRKDDAGQMTGEMATSGGSMTWRHPSGLVVQRQARSFPEFDAVEFTLTFKNESPVELPALSEVNAVDLSFRGDVAQDVLVVSSGGGGADATFPPKLGLQHRGSLGLLDAARRAWFGVILSAVFASNTPVGDAHAQPPRSR